MMRVKEPPPQTSAHLTHDDAEKVEAAAGADVRREAGAVLVFDGIGPCCEVIPLGDAPMELGRGCAALGGSEDPTMSRRHARVGYRDGSFHIVDLGGRNGSGLAGQPVLDEAVSRTARVLRLGQSLLLLCHDIDPYRRLGVQVVGQRVEGPALQQLMRQVGALSLLARTLFILGESGTGKESIARLFHGGGPLRSGPFPPINCATIPEGLAERLLFGAQKGAYSGALADSHGYLLAAAGGTLFLDEVAELDLAVQAKLLRVLETGEVMVLGATRARRVDLRVCCATQRPLRELVAEGRFLADLYFRLGTPQVEVPPLRERLEEIPWYVSQALAEVDGGLRPQASLVESCLLRRWPGNVRELQVAVRAAALAARLSEAGTVGLQHLGAQAGTEIVSGLPRWQLLPPPAALATGDAPAVPESVAALATSRAEVVAAIVRARGNVSAAARALGLSRPQLRRLLVRHQIDLRKLRELA